MSLSANKARLAATTKELTIQWDQTKQRWMDAKSLDFERKYMENLINSVDNALEIIDQLDKLINKIRSDCE